MQQEKVIFAAFLAVFVIFSVQTAANPVVPDAIPPICEPGIVEEMPPHIKKVCMALENSARLNYALTNYIRNEAPALMIRGEDLANSAGKRTDVDHVFLRFGRR